MKNISSIIPSKKTFFIFLFFSLSSILIRSPFFYRDLIDGDESIFIVIGHSIINGDLPYTKIWDNKPPFGYYIFSIIQILFPDSLLAIRVFASLIIATSATCVHHISNIYCNKFYSILSGFVFLVTSSYLIDSGQSLMMEHIAVLPLLASIIFFNPMNFYNRSIFIVGLLISISVFIRLNLIYVFIFVLILIIIKNYKSLNFKLEIKSIGIYIFSFLVISFVAYIPYAITGNTTIFLKTLWDAPLAYSSQSGLSILDTLYAMFDSAIKPFDTYSANTLPDFFRIARLFLRVSFWLFGTLGLTLLTIKHVFQQNTISEKSNFSQLILIITFGVFYSILATRNPYGHYLLQIAPFVSIGCVYFLSIAVQFFNINYKQLKNKIILIFSLILITLTSSIAFTYKYIEVAYSRFILSQSYHGDSFILRDYFKTINPNNDSIFFGTDVLIYWLLKQDTLHPFALFAHPWEIKNAVTPVLGANISTDSIMADILAKKPMYLVFSNTVHAGKYEELPSVNHSLKNDYYLHSEIADRKIYKRKF